MQITNTGSLKKFHFQSKKFLDSNEKIVKIEKNISENDWLRNPKNAVLLLDLVID